VLGHNYFLEEHIEEDIEDAISVEADTAFLLKHAFPLVRHIYERPTRISTRRLCCYDDLDDLDELLKNDRKRDKRPHTDSLISIRCIDRLF
jgi:hypothetical protein